MSATTRAKPAPVLAPLLLALAPPAVVNSLNQGGLSGGGGPPGRGNGNGGSGAPNSAILEIPAIRIQVDIKDMAVEVHRCEGAASRDARDLGPIITPLDEQVCYRRWKVIRQRL